MSACRACCLVYAVDLEMIAGISRPQDQSAGNVKRLYIYNTFIGKKKKADRITLLYNRVGIAGVIKRYCRATNSAGNAWIISGSDRDIITGSDRRSYQQQPGRWLVIILTKIDRFLTKWLVKKMSKIDRNLTKFLCIFRKT